MYAASGRCDTGDGSDLDTGADGADVADVSGDPSGDGENARDGAVDRSSDAPGDGDVTPLCDALQEDWRAFVAQHRGCSVSADCTLVAGAGACDCLFPGLGRPIGNASGDAIASAAATSARVYLDQWSDLGCNQLMKYCVYDAGPAKNLRCDQGECVADNGYCNAPPLPEPRR